MPIPLFPAIGFLLPGFKDLGYAFRDVALDVRPHAPPRVPHSIQKIGVIDTRRVDIGNAEFRPPVGRRPSRLRAADGGS